MKTSCEVIKDLLPLYCDGVCSFESKALINAHLAVCDGCKAELEAMEKVLPVETAERNLNEAEAIQKLSIKWRKGMWKSALKGVLLTIAVIAAILIILYSFMDIKVIF